MKVNNILLKKILTKPWHTLLVLFVFITLPNSFVSAQDCSDKIIEAAALYDVGKFNEVIELISPCSETAVDETERWKSLRLLAMAHLANNENDLAKKASIKFMEIDPGYKPSSLNDPSDFIKLLNEITVIPKLSVGCGISLGINQTLPTVSEAYLVSDQQKVYTGLNKLQIGVSTLYQFNKTYALHASFVVTGKAMELDHSMDNWSLQMNEKLTYLNLPITGRYTYDTKKRLKPFVQVGGYGGLLIFGNSSFFAEHKSSEQTYSLENVSSLDRRNKIDLGLTGGLGLSYTAKSGEFFLQGNYFRSFRNITNEDTRYKFNDLFYSYYYLDDNVTLHNYSVKVGYSYYLNYKVVK
jgi:hypothetical protein